MSIAAPQPQDFTPMWDILRDWLQHATRSASEAPTTFLRKRAAPLMRWIYTLEFVLRRLVLIAATTLIINQPQSHARASTRTQASPATTTPATPPPATKNTFRLYAPDRPKRTHRAAPARTGTTATTNTLPHARRPTAPIDTLLRADQQHLHDAGPLAHREDADAPPPPAPRRAPITYAAHAFSERLAYLAQLIANPDKLIARAARALTRKRSFALRLSEACTPRARGILRTMRRVFADILAPLHHACGDTLQRYAHADTS